MKTIVCYGDSITEGAIGASYVDKLGELLAGEARVVNAGINGDTVLNLLRRVERDVVPHNPDLVIVLVGLNDIGSTYGPWLHRGYYRLVKWIGVRVSPRRFAAGYRKLITTLRERTQAQIVVCTLTTLGEDPADQVHEALDAYSAVIWALALQEGLPLIDLRAVFRAAVAANPRPSVPYFILTVPRDRVEMRLRGIGYADLTARRGYRLLCDGAHLAEAGAELVAETIAPHAYSLLFSKTP